MLSKRELLLQLLELETQNLGNLGKKPDEIHISAAKSDSIVENPITEDVVDVPLTKPKKKLTEKQLEALKKGQQTRDENRKKRLAEMQSKQEAEKKVLEEKLVKKAIAIKKKQIKKQALLEELSGDEEQGTDGSPATPPLPNVPLQKTSSITVPVEKPKPRIIFL
jgi:uncharacterized protein (DUF1800 family)